jgi:hypothetical protein
MISRACIQEIGSGKLSPESQSLLAGLGRRGIPTELFTEKKILRRQLKLSRDTWSRGRSPP